MGIYLLNNTFGQYRNIVLANKTNAEVLNEAYGQRLASTWKTIQFHWDTEDGNERRNIFLYLGSLLVVDEKGRNAISQNTDNIEYLPIDIDGEQWFVVNVCNVFDGVLNLSKSKIERFKDGSIKWIKEFVFNQDCPSSLLFRISEMRTALFASDSFRECLLGSSLVGLNFEDCKIKTPGILRSIFK